MRLFSTKKISEDVNFQEAIFKGLPDDNGLFMPVIIPKLEDSFWSNIGSKSLKEIAFEISFALLKDEIPAEIIESIVNEAIDFDAPTVKVAENIYCLELFHGPSMAFKDFGARFMAGVMSYFLKLSNQKINILVATSGDTGGAVAQGFYGKENITVTILYPKGKVSDIQEKQLTTLGNNVFALEVDGTFDDCQNLVKKAFLDKDLKLKFGLASANSINIARLIPQAFYYVYSFSQLAHLNKKIVFSVPSGNFGNLTAALIAMKMGLPVEHIVAATNVNNVVPNYLESGAYTPIYPSISTISNAMDVGNPSNFPRMIEIFENQLANIQEVVKGYFFDDHQTRKAVKELFETDKYLTCPHSAIGYLGLKSYFNEYGMENKIGVFLSTAHYAKFLPDMNDILGYMPEIPKRLEQLLLKDKVANSMSIIYEDFKSYLENNLIG
jgi:threonine synthase